MNIKPLYIWILQTGEPLHIDEGKPRPMRAMNLSNFLINKGHKVKLISTNFNHTTKSHRSSIKNFFNINKNLSIELIKSPGYKNNISLMRLIDHFILGVKLGFKLIFYKGNLHLFVMKILFVLIL